MLLFRHGQYLIVAQLHITEADKNAVGHGTAPHLRIRKCAEARFVQIRLHVQQEPASGHEIDLQNIVRQRHDRCEISSVQVRALLSAKIKDPPYKYCTVRRDL